MSYLDNYLKIIRNHGNNELADSIQKTSLAIGKEQLQNFDFVSHEVGLLFGNIQSGKTGQMFGILCEAADDGFPAFLILTADNVMLQNQTLERVKTDLTDFVVCGENDSKIFADEKLVRPTIAVIKKNARMLKLWANVFASTGFMKGNPLFIIDDEADAASLNTLVNRDRQSSTNKYIDAIKNNASSSIYLQVTGTPQALFLQTKYSGFRPYFTHYFEPGTNYLGGDFFFPEDSVPPCIVFNDSLENPERSVVITHFAVSAQMLLSGSQVSNCLIHPSVKQSVHDEYAARIQNEIKWCADNYSSFHNSFESVWNTINPKMHDKVAFEKAFAFAEKLIKNCKIIILNDKHEVNAEEYKSGCNFIIGGNTLGRGVTFPALQTIFYTRSSKKPQADTMWQHSRMFGYDRDPGLMSVFIDHRLYDLFSDINASNNYAIAQIRKGLTDVQMIYPEGLLPTRSNVIDKTHVAIISGGTNYFPENPDNSHFDDLNNLLAQFSETEQFYQINMKLLQKILCFVDPSPDFNQKAFIRAIDTLTAKHPGMQGVLIIRRNRDITQRTGALLSPNDYHLAESFANQVVLTMYEVIGKGWKKPKLWVPNIRIPNNINIYDTGD